MERSVVDNVWMGREPRKGIVCDQRKMRKDTVDLLKRLDLDINPDLKMKELTVAQMQMVEIAKAVSFNSKIVIMEVFGESGK